jgi:hypothetical protein
MPELHCSFAKKSAFLPVLGKGKKDYKAKGGGMMAVAFVNFVS